MNQSPLEAEIRVRIQKAGPMSVRQFMSYCLTHPEHGYYVTRDPIGRSGDFVTSPEISQVFGELIGLWAASVWHLMGQPENVRLLELGPGRGTMMLDALRAAQVVPKFRQAIVVHFVEISPVLRRRQEISFGALDVPVMWHERIEELPDGPAIILANEFVDALPINQAIKQFNGWYERTVEIDSAGSLAFGISDEQIPLFEQLLPPQVRDAPVGSIFEWRSENLGLAIGQRIVSQGGAALVIDYGYTRTAVGETLQAVGGHAFANPLVSPGEVDLTAHVDFDAFSQAAERMGARCFGPIDQGRFLRNLGIEKRAMALKAYVPREKGEEVDAGVRRLLGEGRGEMGKLFKAVAFADPKIGDLPGFE